MPELDSIVRNARVVTASVSAFGDPGLGGAKELLDIPVVGISEATGLSPWLTRLVDRE
jgi:Asp/Glu/hydantoin racemase